jgi:hypothetical protein
MGLEPDIYLALLLRRHKPHWLLSLLTNSNKLKTLATPAFSHLPHLTAKQAFQLDAQLHHGRGICDLRWENWVYTE